MHQLFAFAAAFASLALMASAGLDGDRLYFEELLADVDGLIRATLSSGVHPPPAAKAAYELVSRIIDDPRNTEPGFVLTEIAQRITLLVLIAALHVEMSDELAGSADVLGRVENIIRLCIYPDAETEDSGSASSSAS